MTFRKTLCLLAPLLVLSVVRGCSGDSSAKNTPCGSSLTECLSLGRKTLSVPVILTPPAATNSSIQFVSGQIAGESKRRVLDMGFRDTPTNLDFLVVVSTYGLECSAAKAMISKTSSKGRPFCYGENLDVLALRFRDGRVFYTIGVTKTGDPKQRSLARWAEA